MKYCLGLPLVGSRPLTDDERDVLTECYQRARKRRWASLALAWTSTPALFLFLMVAGTMSENAQGAWTILIFVGWLAAIAVGICWAIDSKKRYRLLRLSLNSEVVDVFQRSEDDREDYEDAGPQVLVRIPGTGLILNTLDVKQSKLLTVPSVAAVGPPQPPAAGMLPPRVELVSDEVLRQRSLSAAELDDLRAATKRLSGIAWWQWPLFAYITFGVYATLAQPRTAWSLSHAAVLCVLEVLFLIYGRAQLSLRRQLKADFRAGIVLQVVDGPDSLELLPHSQYIWTHNGQPSFDRRVGLGPRSH